MRGELQSFIDHSIGIPPSFALAYDSAASLCEELHDDMDEDMDASLWGELQSFIDLSVIYAKLPLAPFFRLRQVCKEWNRLASDRQFLEQNFKPPISSNPYFVVTRPSGTHVLLTSEGSSWRSTSLPRTRCEVSGLLFLYGNRVFDLHTRVFHTLPPLPGVVRSKKWPRSLGLPSIEKDPLIMMTVDTTLIPYRFRVIIADEIIGTRVYDSNSGAWMHKPWTVDKYCPLGTRCAHHNKSLYIRVVDRSRFMNQGFYVQIYDLERDEWDCQKLGSSQDNWVYSDIGMWQDRWFVFVVNTDSELVVWESLSNFEEPWTLFDSMPGDLYEWMMSGFEDCCEHKFFGEHVLLYNRTGVQERAVLYNLNWKTWDKIEWF